MRWPTRTETITTCIDWPLRTDPRPDAALLSLTVVKRAGCRAGLRAWNATVQAGSSGREVIAWSHLPCVYLRARRSPESIF